MNSSEWSQPLAKIYVLRRSVQARRSEPKESPALFLSMIAGILALSGLMFIGLKQDYNPEVRLLKQRAHRIFEFDRKSKGLAFNELASLSIALEFGDYQGADRLIRHLEKAIPSQK